MVNVYTMKEQLATLDYTWEMKHIPQLL